MCYLQETIKLLHEVRCQKQQQSAPQLSEYIIAQNAGKLKKNTSQRIYQALFCDSEFQVIFHVLFCVFAEKKRPQR